MTTTNLNQRIMELQLHVHRLQTDVKDRNILIRAMLLSSPTKAITVTSKSLRMANGKDIELVREDTMHDNAVTYYVRERQKTTSPPAGDSPSIKAGEVADPAAPGEKAGA